MSEYGYRVYEAVVDATNSELILFFVIIAVIAIPLYIVVLKGRKAEQHHEREQRQQLIDVIKEMTSVMAGLKVTLERGTADTKTTLDRIHQRIDGQANMQSDILAVVARIETKADMLLKQQVEAVSKVNKILLGETRKGGIPDEHNPTPKP